MLPSQRRIKRIIFKDIFSKGRFFQGKNLTLVSLKSSENSPSKFAFSVSKKIDKRASTRNSLRRRGYSAVKEFLSDIKPNFLSVFVFKSGAQKASFSELKSDIENLLKKAGILD